MVRMSQEPKPATANVGYGTQEPADRELGVGLPFLTPDESTGCTRSYIRLRLPVVSGWRNTLNGKCEPRLHVMPDPN